MKTLILTIIATVFMSTISLGSTVIPESELSIISSPTIELNVINVKQKDFFRLAEYNATKQVLQFVTSDYINYLQIFDETGKLMYQLPVMSKKLKISKKMFNKGSYKIGFITKQNTTIQYTNLIVNE